MVATSNTRKNTKKAGKGLRWIERKDCSIRLSCEPELMPFKGNCSAVDAETDAATEQWIRDQLEKGNEWAWCMVTVRVSFCGLEEDEHLGGCSYESGAKFREPGGYYDDMIDECLDRLNLTLKTMVTALGGRDLLPAEDDDNG